MKTILIVDDTFENLYILKIILEEANYKVIEAKDGKEGLAKLNKNKIDLIISDILMPVMDGYMFCQACKKNESFKDIPFVFYTSTYVEESDEIFGLNLGAIKFLIKPIDPLILISTIGVIFSEHKVNSNPIKVKKFTEEEVLKLYSKRLIGKLEQKNLDLGNEVLERERAEQLLISKNEILDLFTVNTPLNKIFDQLLLNFESTHPDYYGSISLVDKEGQNLILESAPSLPKSYRSTFKSVPIITDVGSCSAATITKKPVIVADISTNKLWEKYKNIALKYELKSCWSIPILSRDNIVLGTFAIYSKSVKSPSLDEIREVNFAVSLANIALEKSRIVSEIKKKDESYKALIDQASDAILTYSLDGTIHGFNKATCQILGYNLDELSKLKIQDIIIGDFISQPDTYKRILAGESVFFERQFRSKSNILVDLEISAKKQKDGNILSIGRNITERKKAELKLQESEYNLRQSQIVANIGSYTVDLITMTWVGSAVLDGLLGIDETYPKTVENWSLRIHPDERESMLNHLEYCIQYHKKFSKEYRIIKLNTNEEIWVHGIGDLVLDDENKPIKLIGTIQDINHRKRAEIKLRESEFSLRQSQVVANIGSFGLDINTKLWESSPVLNQIFGINKSYVKTIENWFALIHPEDRETISEYLKEGVESKGKIDKEYRVFKLDSKEEVWVHGIGELFYDNEGKPSKIIGTVQDITHRKQAEIKLQESEYSLRQSQFVGNIGSYVLDLNTRTWESSAMLNVLFGIPESYVKTIENWVQVIHPDERDLMFNYLENGIQNNTKFDKEYRVVKLDSKEEIWVHGTGEFIYDSDGKSVKMIGTMQDITHRKRSEIILKESQKSLLIAQELAKIGSFDLRIKTLIGDTSITFKNIIGVDSDTVVDFDLWKAVVHPEDRSLIKNSVFECLNLKQAFNLEYRIITKDSRTLKWIHGIGEIVYSDGKATNFVGTIQDITARKKIELDLEIANKFSLSLLKSMHEGLVAINLESEIISVNPSFCKMTGFTENELLGVKRPYPFSPPERREENNERYKLLIQNKNKKDYENTYMRKNGERFPVHVLLSSIYDENGVRTANFATIEDITERKKAEINLQLAKDFNDKLVMSMQEGLIIVDPNGEIIMVNDSYCTIIGYSKEELLGLNLPYPFAKIEDLENILKFNERIAKGEGESLQFEFIRKNGEKFLASFLAGNIKNDNGEVIALFGTMKDVSKEERAKAILKNKAKKSLERKNVIIELASLVGTDYKEALNKITELSAKTLNIERGSILKFNEAKTEMFCEKLYTKEIDSFESGQVYYKKENDTFFNEIQNNNIVAASDVSSHEIYKDYIEEYFRPLNIKSKLSIPIQGIDEVYGILCFEQVGDFHNWSTDEEEFASSIASLVSLMIQSSERKLAEVSSLLANNQLTLANNELNNLRNQLEQENVYLRNELDLVFNYEDMVYGSAEFSNVLTELEKVAPTKASVLLLGESGTGKELLARAIHNISTRNKKPLIKVNCAAIPRELLESELFGHKKGSFTGAFNDKIGKFELADQGTLFLDEIGELPLDMQPKILRFLQEGEIEVVGGLGTKKLDVRIIAATNRNLKEEIDKKRFREDLYFRLNVFPINVPALRERKDDIPLLVEHFVDKFNKSYGKNIKYIAEDAMSKLKNYDWPGNIRELENLIERASILSTDTTLFIPGFESAGQEVNPINNKDLSLDVAQRNHIFMVLEQCNWKISGPNGAAKLLNIKPSTLRDRMKKLDLKKGE